MLQRMALQELHGDVRLRLEVTNLQYCADIGMIDCGGRACFPAEALECVGFLNHIRREELERDAPAESGVFGLIHQAHSAAAKLAENAVLRDRLADHWRKS